MKRENIFQELYGKRKKRTFAHILLKSMRDIASLFNSIAPTYDKLNHLLSLNIDKYWRSKSLKNCSLKWQKVLDVACGTADFTLQIAQTGVPEVIGIDLSEAMVNIGKEKVKNANFQEKVHLMIGDCVALPFPENSFDAVTVAFGVRNFAQRAYSLNEMRRVLKPNGDLVILEFSTPKSFPIKQLYRFYFKRWLPFVGGIISGDKAAYQYLPESVYAFPQGEAFMQELRDAGLRNMRQCRMTLGIATVYYAKK